MVSTRKTRYLGQESGKSSDRWFGRGVGHPKGHGASAGDGRTTDKGLLAKGIEVIFRTGNRPTGGSGK